MERASSFRLRWRPRPALAAHVAFVWAECTADDEALLPDGAVELVWSGRGLFVRGVDSATPTVSTCGLRPRVRLPPAARAASTQPAFG